MSPPAALNVAACKLLAHMRVLPWCLMLNVKCFHVTQGHFQVFFHNEHCPLFQSKLSILQRIMYCQGVWSYVVGAISTPTFVVVPLVTIWAGVFPIVLNWWAAIALSVFYAATTLVRPLTASESRL